MQIYQYCKKLNYNAVDINVVRNDEKLLRNYQRAGRSAIFLDSAKARAESMRGLKKESAANKKLEKAETRYT